MMNIETNLNQALECINNEDFIQAQSILKEIIKHDNKNIEAYKNLGLCEVNLDNPQGAIEAFVEVLHLNNDDAVARFYLANCYSRIGEKERAIEEFNQVLLLRPDYLDAYKSLAMIYVEFSQVDSAIETVKKALDNENIVPDYSLYYIIATSYMLKKDNENAIIYLAKAFELNNSNISIANSLAVCYMNIDKYSEAEEILDIAKGIDENNALTYYNYGILNQAKGEFKNALEYFQKSYELEPSITMLSTLAQCSLKAGEFLMAQTLYKNLTDVYPNNNQYRISLIEAYDATMDYTHALEQLNLLLEHDNKSPDLIKKKGTYLRKLGLFDEAIEAFNSLVVRGKIDVEVYYNLAFSYYELGDFDNAKEMFKKCIILEPNNPYAHKDLGVLYLKMNCYEWAQDEMQEAIRLEDDVAEFHYSLGVSYMMLSKIDEARKALEKSIELDGNNADALAYYGYVLISDNEYEHALEILQKALKIDVNNFLAKTHIAKLYFKLQKYDIAKEFLLDITKDTKDDEVMNMLAVSYMNTNEFENAMGILSKLAPKYPKNHILLTDLAKCEIKSGKIHEAQEHLRQALMIYDDYKEALDLLEEIK